MTDPHAFIAEYIEAAFPLTLNSAALRAMMSEDEWRHGIDAILDTLPPDILAKMTERDAAQLMIAAMRAILHTHNDWVNRRNE